MASGAGEEVDPDDQRRHRRLTMAPTKEPLLYNKVQHEKDAASTSMTQI
jgi:hypothetical protein